MFHLHYAQPENIPSTSFHLHMSSQRMYLSPCFTLICPTKEHTQFEIVVRAVTLTFTKSWSIFASYMMSTSILITFMFTVPGRSLLQDVPPVLRHPSDTLGDPTPSTAYRRFARRGPREPSLHQSTQQDSILPLSIN